MSSTTAKSNLNAHSTSKTNIGTTNTNTSSLANNVQKCNSDNVTIAMNASSNAPIHNQQQYPSVSLKKQQSGSYSIPFYSSVSSPMVVMQHSSSSNMNRYPSGHHVHSASNSSSSNSSSISNSSSVGNNESPVIHFRQIPSNVTQNDLLLFASNFGNVSHFLSVKNHQALIQFTSLEAAKKLMNAFPQHKCSVKGQDVYLSYSSHQQLMKGKLGELAPHQIKPQQRKDSSSLPNTYYTTQTTENASHILLVSLPWSLNCSQLHHIFSIYGQIHKIVIFTKNGLQALIQFSKVEEAQNAKNALQGKWPNTQFSHLKDLTVKENSERMRDYTNPDLPTNFGWVFQPEEIANISGLFSNTPLSASLNPISAMAPPVFNPLMNGSRASPTLNSLHQNNMVIPSSIATPSHSSLMITQSNNNEPYFPEKCVLLVSNFNENDTNLMHLFNLFSCYGYISRLKLFQKHQKRNHALIQMGNSKQANMAISSLKGVRLCGFVLNINFSKHFQIRDTSQESGASKFDDKNITVEKLAQMAFINFEKIPLHLNRYSRQEKNSSFRRVCAPSDTLHISNFEKEKMSQERLRLLFSRFGNIGAVKIWQYESNGLDDNSNPVPGTLTTDTSPKVRIMGLVKFEDFEDQKSVDMAVKALCHMHNAEVDGRRLRVSFSMNKID
jgi:hnRNP-L/PTB/hephaestus splicing factor